MTTAHSTRSIGARIAGAALNLAALGGLVAVALLALTFFFNVSLIMFKTGSMSPSIPAGAVAVVREIPAADIKIGDVITVDRPGELPITHRVMTVTESASPSSRVVTLKGDANKLEDPTPYTVSDVRVVVASVPGLASVLVWFSSPFVLGSITLAATFLVLWAFWPRSIKRSSRHSVRPTGGAAVA